MVYFKLVPKRKTLLGLSGESNKSDTNEVMALLVFYLNKVRKIEFFQSHSCYLSLSLFKNHKYIRLNLIKAFKYLIVQFVLYFTEVIEAA